MLVTAVYAREDSRKRWQLVGTAPYYTTEYPDPVKEALKAKADALGVDHYRWSVATIDRIEESAAAMLDGIRAFPASMRRTR